MRTAARFADAGFNVVQSPYYVDPETSAAREIDVLAHKENVETDAWLRVSCVVECKSGRDAPWIVFPNREGLLAPHARVSMLGASILSRPFLSRISRNIAISGLKAFSSTRISGLGMVQAFKEHPDHAFAAMMGAGKAASYLLDEWAKHSEADETFDLVWPLIVTEAPLFQATLSAENELSVEKIDAATVLWRHPSIGPGLGAIEVVTAEFAEQHIPDIGAAIDAILTQTATELERSLAKRRERAAQRSARAV